MVFPAKKYFEATMKPLYKIQSILVQNTTDLTTLVDYKY